MTTVNPPQSPRTMYEPNLPYEVLKQALIADAEYWNGIQTPYDPPKERPYLGEDMTEYDDYPDTSDGEEY